MTNQFLRTSQCELELDLGNTFSKWRLADKGQYVSEGVSSTDDIKKVIEDARPERILCASVVAETVLKEIETFARAQGVGTFTRVLTASSYGHITNGYVDYRQLGIDRWLAVIAARYITRSSVVVVDFGSALTIDYLDSAGFYKGGYIVPGSRLCFEALSTRTAALANAYHYQEAADWGVSTRECIENGVFRMQLSFVLAAFSDYPDALPVCTGGGVSQFKASLPIRCHYEPSLVLDGLRIVADNLEYPSGQLQ